MFAGLYVRGAEIEFEVKHIENPLIINKNAHIIDYDLVNPAKSKISRFPSVRKT